MNHIRITFRYEGGITAATAAVEALRQRALALPFHSVESSLTSFRLFGGADVYDKHSDALYDHVYSNVRCHDLLCDSLHRQYLLARYGSKDSFKSCRRNAGCGFMVQPLPESVPVSFGLYCQIPFRNLGQWTWRTFTTVFDRASSQRPTVVRSHLAMIRLLDHANELGLLRQVVDRSGYFESRQRSLLTGNDPRLERLVARLESLLWPKGNKPQAA